MLIDGVHMDICGVGGLRRIKNAMGVAKACLLHTTHTLLVGDQATAFAVENGFPLENLTTPASAKIQSDWKAAKCQPNYRVNVYVGCVNYCNQR
jgi:N4-(beta-N-acetylglucosaminyl)-L-asparaginase